MANATIEHYLLDFDDALVAGAQRRERILAEVEEHLRDAMESSMAAGMAADEAQLEVLARFGSPREAAKAFGPDPLGRAQQASRWWEARRIAHPVLIPLAIWSPLLAYMLWEFGLFVPLVPLVLLGWQLTNNLQARRAAGFAPRPGRIAHRAQHLRLAFADRPRIGSVLGWTPVIGFFGWSFVSWDPWFRVIVGYYAVCLAVSFWARPVAPSPPEAQTCAERWTQRHASPASAMRGCAWAVALAGAPVLTELLSITAGHAMFALLGLTMFLAFSPAPTLRSQQWLHERRPASQFFIRIAPVIALIVFAAVRNPLLWGLVPLAVLMFTSMAARREISYSRFRSAAARRRLADRARGVAGDTGG